MSQIIKVASTLFFILLIIGWIVLGNMFPAVSVNQYSGALRTHGFNWTLFLAGAITSLIGYAFFYSLGVILERLENVELAISQLLEETVQSTHQKEYVQEKEPLEATPPQERKAAAPGEIVTPIEINPNMVQCSACGKQQRAGRKQCFFCGVRFSQNHITEASH